ncbi:MAG TPA: Rrf2 family transcriptional regulator [Alphaproteobacteria bacterium]|nr:Rrf2 family transcriptional regulator [Alphaproteobacteria bacterium]
MKISARGRYAVRGMLDVALNSRNFPTPLADISLRQAITISNLEQLFAKLRRAGLVRSVRGPGGGYFLAKSPHEITIADILRAVEEPLAPQAKTTDSEQEVAPGQRIDDLLIDVLWSRLTEQVRQILESITLQDLVDEWEKSEPPGFIEHRYLFNI